MGTVLTLVLNYCYYYKQLYDNYLDSHIHST